MAPPQSFASILAPMTIAEFRERHWGRAAVVLPKRADRFASLPFDFETLCTRMHSDKHPEVKAQYFDRAGTHCDMLIEPRQIKGCFEAGMTVCITRVDPLLPELESVVEEWRRSLSCTGKMSFSCYWSPNGAGFGTHYDDRPVFICQLKGSKRWWFSRAPATREPHANFLYTPEGTAALRADGLSIEEPTDEFMESAVLEPGDVLYLPSGTWHRTSAVGESLALTLRVFEGTPAQIARETLKRFFDDDTRWRTPLPMIDEAEEVAHRIHPVVEQVLTERLAALKAFVGALTVDDLARTWAEAQSREVLAPPPSPLAPQDRLQVARNIRVLRAGTGDSEVFHVFNGAREIELLVRDNAWFEAILHARELTASDACAFAGGMAWNDAKELLEDLIGHGILRLVQ